MAPVEALHAAVCDAPEDMAPRRAYAEAVKATDPERARLIELQLALRDARRAGSDPDATAARDLVKRLGAKWAGTFGKAVDYFMYWGGFIEEIEVDAEKLLVGDVGRAAPIRHLRVRELAGKISAVANLRWMDRIRSLDVQSCRLNDADLGELVSSPRLRGLRLLRIGNNPDVTLDGLRAIARAGLPELRFVDSSATHAPLVIHTDDLTEVSFTRAQAALVEELGELPWLVAQDEPSLDVI